MKQTAEVLMERNDRSLRDEIRIRKLAMLHEHLLAVDALIHSLECYQRCERVRSAPALATAGRK